ncbi:hypothetical protein COOONC_24734 [Cooperia oncophora]
MVELLVDCSRTEQLWFGFKGYMSSMYRWSGWEPDISQKECSGIAGGKSPFKSNNHMAKCGAVNVFSWGSNACLIDPI